MLRKHRPEFALLTALASCAAILSVVVEWIGSVAEELLKITEECGVDMQYFTVIVKVIGTAYITQFAAEILRDSGENAIASKVEAAGKICILALTMPVMASFMELCVKVVNSV